MPYIKLDDASATPSSPNTSETDRKNPGTAAQSDWDQYLMGQAEYAASKSKDGTRVGAVLVAQDGRGTLMTSFNGPAAGVKDHPERREQRPLKYRFACHAEANLIYRAARYGVRTEGCTVYTTHHPCSGCANAMAQAGIRRLVYGPGKTSMPADEFEAAEEILTETGIVSVGMR